VRRQHHHGLIIIGAALLALCVILLLINAMAPARPPAAPAPIGVHTIPAPTP
jgi:hypothetical protein